MSTSQFRRPEKGTERLNWTHVRLLYLRELRAALREKSIVTNSILIPVFLYPFLLWAAMTGITFIMGQTESFQLRVAVAGWHPDHPKLRLKLEHMERLTVLQETNAASARRDVKAGKLDAWLEFVPLTGEAANLPGNFTARITYDQSKERSEEAQRKLKGAVDQYRVDWQKREARRRGVSAAEWQGFTISSNNLASNQQMGVFMLGLIAPAIFVIMVAVGCFYPAVDCTAGERERSTWETLMSTAASRLSVVAAKYFYVATLGGLAGILNLAAVMLTLKPVFAPLLEKAGKTIDVSVPLSALPVACVVSLLLAGFVAAGMMLFAAFARTFKEGQAMITPFYLVVLVPVVFMQVPGIKFTLPMACVPIANLTMTLRSVLSGSFPWLQITVSMIVTVVLIILFLRLASFILRFEDVMLGSYNGSLFKFLSQKILARRATP